MEKYIYIKQRSISQELCKDIIELFENEGDNRYRGYTLGGVHEEIKKSLDFFIEKNNKTSKWHKIARLLQKELHKNVFLYMEKLKAEFSKEYEYYLNTGLFEFGYQMQKYDKNDGKYVFHHDFTNDHEKKIHRVVTFLWYINTVEDGGETEFDFGLKIKPEVGKLILFPASWTFPHRGNMPISGDKYIITGWLYTK